MGLAARKPVFRGLHTTKVQTSLLIHAVWSEPLLFAYYKVLYLNLWQAKFQIFQLVSVSEQAGLGMTWSEAPKTGFLAQKKAK